MSEQKFSPEEVTAALRKCAYGQCSDGACRFREECQCGQNGGGMSLVAADMIEELTAENARLREENRWIPVEERLPDRADADDRDDVWVWFRGYVTTWKWYQVTSGKEFTHWRPAPKGPEGVAEC